MVAFTEIIICEMALSRIGVPVQITDDGGFGLIAGSDDSTIEQRVCEQWYSRVRDAVLEDAPWTFAKKFITLTQHSDGVGKEWVDEWEFAYLYPEDCLTLRRFVNDVGTGFYEQGYDYPFTAPRYGDRLWAWKYRIAIDAGVKVILTDVENDDADIEYTYRVEDAALFPNQFVSALAWRLGSEIAGPLSVSVELQQQAAVNYNFEVGRAKATNLNEPNDHELGDGSFNRARGGD